MLEFYRKTVFGLIAFSLFAGNSLAQQVTAPAAKPLRISGVYPHLAAFNQPPSGPDKSHGEAGIGAIVPWAGKLWYLTYPQHKTTGSHDKLYMVDADMNLTVRPESVGGTHACRMIHRESNQLIIGPYFIDSKGKVRSCDLQRLRGRMTAVMRHLRDPANMVYFYDMEGAIYEVNVHTLDVKLLHKKPFPGWHGKGAYTSDNRVVFSNNGERNSKYRDLSVGGQAVGDEAGILAEWDGGDKFNIIERKQFTDVTGPRGIHGGDKGDPLWAMGWDRRSVILKLLDNGRWSTFRLPKASHSFDHRHGWYTEWPRIREIVPGSGSTPPRLMIVMHASMFDFPSHFSQKKTSGIRPLATHLRYVPDFCHYNGKIIIGADEAAMMENPLCGQAQSNLWFGTLDQIRRFGGAFGVGGPWLGDQLQAAKPSDPYLFAGYGQRVAHIKNDSKSTVVFSFEKDTHGTGQWTELITVTVPSAGYAFHIFDSKTDQAEWVRVSTDKDCRASVYFHYLTPRENNTQESALFDSLADIESQKDFTGGMIRPAARNRSLQWLTNPGGKGTTETVCQEVELDGRGSFQFSPLKDNKKVDSLKKLTAIKKDFTTDNASVIVTTRDGKKWRLPKGPAAFDNVLLRGVREVQSERWLANLHGTFYEIPRAADNRSPDFARMRPVSSHRKRIVDFCSWRGLLVLSGVKNNTPNNGQAFADAQGRGLWFGAVDDLWKLGRPKGQGGPWRAAAVTANCPSDPYLMTGYDSKTVSLSHDGDNDVTFTLEVDFDHSGFVTYKKITVAPGKTVKHTFPKGYNAHWIRLKADASCHATAWFTYK